MLLRSLCLALPCRRERLLRHVGHFRERIDDGVRIQSARLNLKSVLSVHALLEERLDAPALLGLDEGGLDQLPEARDKRIERLPLRLTHLTAADLHE